MTGTAITDAIIARYWQWVVTLTQNDFNTGNVIHDDPASGLAFLCDPTDAPNGYSQNTNTKLAAGQQVLIPLFIAAADIPCQFCNVGATNINLVAERNYLLGHVKSQVSIKLQAVSAGNGGVLDVDVCGTPNPGPVTNVSINPPTLFHASAINIALPPGINITQGCKKKVCQNTWCTGIKNNFTSVGFWTVISPSDIPNHGSWSNGDTIQYNTVVTGANGANCAPPVFANGLSTTITYTVTGL